MMGFIRIFLILLALLTLTFASTSVWLLRTSHGAETAFSIAGRFIDIKVDELSGNFHQGLLLQHLALSDPSLKLSAADLEVRIDLWSFLSLEELSVEHLSATSMHISTGTSETSSSSDPIDAVALPPVMLPLSVANAEIARIDVNGQLAEAMTLSLEWNDSALTLHDAAMTFADVALAIRGSITTRKPLRPDLHTDWKTEAASGNVIIAGSLSQLRIEATTVVEDRTILSNGFMNLADLPQIGFDFDHRIPADNLVLHTEGSGQGDQWKLAAEAEYQNWPIELDALLTAGESGWVAHISRAILADVIQVTGKVALNDAPSGMFEFRLDDLTPAGVPILGNITGSATFTKDEVLASAAAEKIGWDDVAQGRNLRMDLKLTDLQEIDLNLTADSVSTTDLELQALTLRLSGPIDHLNAEVNWTDSALTGLIDLREAYPSLEIHAGSHVSLNDVHLNTQQTIRVQQLTTGWTISAHCWHGVAELCVEPVTLADTTTSELAGSLHIAELSKLNVFLPMPLSGGSIAARWSLALKPGEWWGEATVDTTAVILDWEGRPVPLPDFNVDAYLSAERISAQVTGTAAGVSLSADVEHRQPDGYTNGSASFEFDLAGLDQFDARLSMLTGSASGDASFVHDGQVFDFSTQGVWQNGTVNWQELSLSDISATWIATPQQWTLAGTGTPRDGGEVSISGSGNGYTLDSQLSGQVRGSNLSLATDDWKITAAPDLTVNVDRNLVTFNGNVDVPDARIEIDTLPASLPKPSRDVRVIGRAQETNNGERIRGSVTVRLGDDVRLKLFLLDIALKGELDAGIVGDEVVSLVGELAIGSGTLTASGQTLSVEEGRILFTGDPNNPYVDILALRSIPDRSPPLKVGLRITGLADELQTNIYSNPLMSETRALSFLVLGRDFNETSDANSSQLLTAALGFGLRQSQGVVQELRGALGLDELSALSNAQNEVAIVAGKRVTEDLYVRYSYNALSAVGALIIRYHLGDRWRLEATNDLTSSMDLLYEFRR